MKFYSNGKLLITGEYTVLDGANALALPTVFGQWLIINKQKESLKLKNGKLYWQSFDNLNTIWFECEFDLPNFKIENCKEENLEIATTLQLVLIEAQKMNLNFLKNNFSYNIETKLTFAKNGVLVHLLP